MDDPEAADALSLRPRWAISLGGSWADPEVPGRKPRGRPADLPRGGSPPHLTGMTLDLTDAEAAALVTLLKHAIADDHFPLSPEVRTLQGILDRLEPPRARPAVAPEPRVYEPPGFIRGRRQRE